MAFVVVYDACVLYPSGIWDPQFVRARWTNTILDECFSALKKNRPDLYQIDLVPAAVVRLLSDQARSKKTPPRTVDDILEQLHREGLVQSVARLRELMT